MTAGKTGHSENTLVTDGDNSSDARSPFADSTEGKSGLNDDTTEESALSSPMSGNELINGRLGTSRL